MKKTIAIVLGSKNDEESLKEGFLLLKEFSVPYRLEIISAHRHPDKLRDFCKQIEKDKYEVVIACAGMAAALPGFIASYVNIPVLGVALKGGMMDGLDAVFSMISIPKGLGLSSTGMGKSAFINAIIFSLEILALRDKKYLVVLKAVKQKFRS